MLRLVLASGVLLALTGCQACVDLKQERAYPCARDAGPDEGQCPEGWTCGLEGTCHSRAVEGDYVCQTDEDCVGDTWRCGPDARCVNAELDALAPSPSGAGYRVKRASPALLDSQPEHLAISDQFQVVDSCGGTGQNFAVSWVLDGGLTKQVIFRDPKVIRPNSGALPDGGSACSGESYAQAVGDIVLEDVASTTLSGPVVALVEAGSRTYALLASGALCTYDWALGAGLSGSCSSDTIGFQATQLRLGSRNDSLIAFNDTQLSVLAVSNGTRSGPFSIPSSAGGNAQIFDITTGGLDVPHLYVATSRGLFVARLERSNVSPFGSQPAEAPFASVQLVNRLGCDLAGAEFKDLPVRLQLDPEERFLLLTLRDRNSKQSVLLLSSTAGSAPSCPELPLDDKALTQETHLFSDGDCDSGSIDHVYFVSSTLDDHRRVQVQARCAAGADGKQDLLDQLVVATEDASGTLSEIRPDFLRVDRNLSPGFLRAAKAQRSNPRRQAVVNDLGQLWYADVEVAGSLPIVPDRLPTSVMGGADDWVISFDHTPVELGVNASRHVLAKARFMGWPGSRLIPNHKTDTTFDVLSGLEGERAWMLLSLDAIEDGLPPILADLGSNRSLVPSGLMARLPPTVEPPFRGAVATRGDGARIALISANDSLYAVEAAPLPLEELQSFSQLTQMPIRLVPLPRATITSLVTLPPAPMAPLTFLQGYLLASSRLFHFETRSATVWRADEVLLNDGDPIKVFSDGKSGRVGLADGRVFGLPSRAQIAPVLPASAVRSGDFAEVCSQVFALGRDGVYRLAAASGEPEGTWTPVPLDVAWLSAGGARLEEGQLHAAERALLVISPNGRTVLVDELGCSP